jgi:uncharacterized protein DUF2628
MTVYSILEKPQEKAANKRVRFAPPVAVPDRFSWLAAILPPVFALAHGLWLLLLFWIVLVLGLGYTSLVIGDTAAGAIYVLVALFLGFEAPAFRRDALLGRGYLWRGDVIAAGADLAERDFLARRS